MEWTPGGTSGDLEDRRDDSGGGGFGFGGERRVSSTRRTCCTRAVAGSKPSVFAIAARMASGNPAMFLGLADEIGRIAPGYRANLVLATDDLSVVRCWIDGREVAGGQA